jgi:CBS domain-containing protein
VAWLGTLGTAEHSALGVELRVLVWSNLVIAVFNALPGLPLDGGRVLRAGIWGLTRSRLTGTRVAAWGGRVLAVLVAVGGVLFERGDLRLITVVFAVALGAFMWLGASQSLASAEMTARLPSLSSTTLMRRAIWVQADTPVEQAMRRLHETGARAIVVIDRTDRPVAVVSEARITAVPQSARAWTDVAEVADAVGAVHPLPLGLSGRDLLSACQVHPASEYLVVDAGGHGVGVMAMADLRAALLSSKRPEGVPA